MTSEIIDWKNDTGRKFEKHAKKQLINLYPFFLKDIIELWGQKIENKKVLEIGPGPGFMLREFEKAKASLIIAYDLSFEMLVKSNNNSFSSDKSLYINGCAEVMPFKPDSFDVVFSRGSIFFWKNKQQCLQNILKVLKKGGIALVGGGYSMSAPDKLLPHTQSKPDKIIPRINPEKLLSNLSNTQKADLISKKGRGFWIRIIK